VLVVGQYFVSSDPAALNQRVKTILTAGIVALAVLFAAARLRHFHAGGDHGASVWFYDQSAKRLYPAPGNLVPPDGGNARVRAIVIGFKGMGNEVSQLKIAYLEKYSPDFKALLERAKAARVAKRPFNEKVPSRNSPYFHDNTFVKRPDETSWHNAGTDEARQIMTEWHQWRGPAGQPPIISVPSP
jgi:hypothetical protein